MTSMVSRRDPAMAEAAAASVTVVGGKARMLGALVRRV
jgi:hypothetical protein